MMLRNTLEDIYLEKDDRINELPTLHSVWNFSYLLIARKTSTFFQARMSCTLKLHKARRTV